jgi:hypothetical protein
MDSEAKKISEVMAIIGARKSEKKAAASRANGAATRWARKPLAEILCTCGGGASVKRADHRGTCPKWRAIRYREMRDLPLD